MVDTNLRNTSCCTSALTYEVDDEVHEVGSAVHHQDKPEVLHGAPHRLQEPVGEGEEGDVTQHQHQVVLCETWGGGIRNKISLDISKYLGLNRSK